MRDFLPNSAEQRAILDATRSAIDESKVAVERPFGIPRKVSSGHVNANLEEIILFIGSVGNIVIVLPSVKASDAGRIVVIKHAAPNYYVYYRASPGTIDGSSAIKRLSSRGEIARVCAVGVNEWELI